MMDLNLDFNGDIEIRDDDVVINHRPAQWIYLKVATPKGSHFFHDAYGNPYNFVGSLNDSKSHAEAINAMEDIVRQEKRIIKAEIDLQPRINYMLINVNINDEEFEMRLDNAGNL